ncbi:anti-sigma regulatory factor [Ureibacillus composti]
MSEESIVEIVTEWDIVTARQQGRNEAKAIGFTTVDQARIATAISELAKNIYLYASEGDIIIERLKEKNRIGIAITAIDKGPGIANLQSVLEDSFSNSGSSSVGIPAVKRLMDKLEIESEVGKGTKVRIEKWLKR